MNLCRTVSDINGDNGNDNDNKFSSTMHLTLPLRVLPWKFVAPVGVKKARMMAILDGVKFDNMCVRLDTIP